MAVTTPRHAGKHFSCANGPFEMIPTPAYEISKRKANPSNVGIYGKLLDSLSITEESNDFVQSASVMALTHNVILRGLNSIYLQADLVKEDEVQDFIGYCLCWVDTLETHHHHEEDFFFPEIERTSSQPGLMEVNVQQHGAFESGLQAFTAYLHTIHHTPSSTPTPFSANHLLTLIDDFGSTLHSHLGAEILSLLSLAAYPTVPITKLSAVLISKSEKEAGKTTGAIMFFLNQDLGFEEGMWRDWPPIPWFVRRMLVSVLGRWRSGWWRWAACDVVGVLKVLREDGEVKGEMDGVES